MIAILQRALVAIAAVGILQGCNCCKNSMWTMATGDSVLSDTIPRSLRVGDQLPLSVSGTCRGGGPSIGCDQANHSVVWEVDDPTVLVIAPGAVGEAMATALRPGRTRIRATVTVEGDEQLTFPDFGLVEVAS